MKNNRLETIATRQRSSRIRDVMFAFAVALAAIISVSSVALAADAAAPAPTHVAHVAPGQ